MPKTTSSGPRAFVSEFSLQVGPISTVGKLINVTRSNRNADNEYVSVCPTCPEPIRVKQQYVCHDHPTHVFTQGELTFKGRDVGDGVLVKVSAEEVKAARASELPVNVFRATVHPAEDVEKYTYSDDKAYVFIPRNADEYYGLLMDMVGDAKSAFVAVANVRNTEGLFRLRVWGGNIVLERLLWPEDLNQFEPVNVEHNEQLTAAAEAMVERISTPFEPEQYRSAVRERLQAVNAALAGEAPLPKDIVTPKQKVDILAALESFGS